MRRARLSASALRVGEADGTAEGKHPHGGGRALEAEQECGVGLGLFRAGVVGMPDGFETLAPVDDGDIGWPITYLGGESA